MRIKYLDGIKGLGAIGVFLCHYNMFNFPSPVWFHDSWISKWFMSGGYAVALFLIISGFSALFSVKKKLADNTAVSRIIVNRYFRFSIPFGIAFLILYLTNFLGLYSYHIKAGELLHSEALRTAFWPVNVVGFCKSLLLSPINPDFWDAPLWMMKYVFLSTYIALLFSLAISVVDNKRKYLISIFILIFLSVYDIFFSGIVTGIIFAYFYLDKSGSILQMSKQKRIWIGACCFLGAIILRYYLKGSAEFINIASAAFLLLGVHFMRLIQKIFESSFFQYLGKISFGIFIWHWPIMCSLTSFLYVETYKYDSLSAICCTLIPTIVCVIIVSHFSEKYLEKKISNVIIKKIMTFLYKSI